jgi:hypothetical protein
MELAIPIECPIFRNRQGNNRRLIAVGSDKEPSGPYFFLRTRQHFNQSQSKTQIDAVQRLSQGLWILFGNGQRPLNIRN